MESCLHNGPGLTRSGYAANREYGKHFTELSVNH